MEEDQDLTEKRELKRWQLIFYLRVFDQETGSLLGHIVDITTEGLMLISETPIPTERDYRLWIEIPQEGGERQRIPLEARSLWHDRDINPACFDTGFRLINITPEALHKIRLLIDDLKFYE